MKYILTFVLLFSIALPSYASEVTGTLTTGVSTGNGVQGMLTEAPTASPTGGSYTSTQDVVLTGGAGSTSVHYTTDGSTTPTCTTGSTYSSSISVAVSTTILAVSCYASDVASEVATFVYAITAAASGGGGSGGGGGIIPPATCDADFNNDGNIDIFDLNILSFNWGSITATDTTGDADCNGTVDIFDLNILTTNWTG